MTSDDDVQRLFAGEQASHLCHQPTCINRQHIVVEPKAANEARKGCPLGPTIITQYNGVTLRLVSPNQCSCPGQKCVAMVERRVAEEI